MFCNGVRERQTYILTHKETETISDRDKFRERERERVVYTLDLHRH